MINRSITLGICFVLLPNVVGCTSTALNQSEDTPLELMHDFGEICADQKGEMLTREFTIRNPSGRTMKLAGRHSSCSCVLLQGDNNSRDFADVPPHDSIQVKAGVLVDRKVGPFAESITLHYEGVKQVKYLLHLQGTVLSSPRPVLDQIRFVRSGDSTLQRECLCSYQRKKTQKPIHLVDARILYNSASESGFTFDVGEPLFKSVDGSSTTVIETWSLPIVLNSQSKSATGTASLKLGWSDGSSSSIKLIVESERQIEILQSRVMLETDLGSSYTTRVPVRFTSKLVDGPYEIVSDADWCSAELDVQKQAIVVRADGIRLGRHECILSLREKGLESFQMEVECTVNAVRAQVTSQTSR